MDMLLCRWLINFFYYRVEPDSDSGYEVVSKRLEDIFPTQVVVDFFF